MNRKILSLQQVVSTSCLAILFCFYCSHSIAATACPQAYLDGTTPPATTSTITPRVPITAFYQWENNNGYCGEVDILEAGMNSGQWMSQYNVRAVCGAMLDSVPSRTLSLAQLLPNDLQKYPNPLPLTVGQHLDQAGPGEWCSIFKANPHNNAQVCFQDPKPGVFTGTNDFGHMSLCLSNARLKYVMYDYTKQPAGEAGYQQYMSWIKSQIIAGKQVGIGVVEKDNNDSQYDHIVMVAKIGTNHSVTDPTYYPDDVLYIEDHGAYAVDLKNHTIYDRSPSIPPGAADRKTCTPYIYGASFAEFGQSRKDASKKDAHVYSIIIPGAKGTTPNGADGLKGKVKITTHNFGIAVAGPADDNGVTLPVVVSITSSSTNGKANPMDPIAGYNYEHPMIGFGKSGADDGNICTNTQPPAMNITLNVKVSGLTPGVAYNLYEYDFNKITGTGSKAALAVPTANFNANASMATSTTAFVATATTYAQNVTTTSDKIVVFRAVPASAS